MNYVCFVRVNTANEIEAKGGHINRIGTIWIEYYSPTGEPLTFDSYTDK